MTQRFDPADFRAGELASATHAVTAHCVGCQDAHGQPDQQKIAAMEGAGCVFGCPRPVDSDTGVCPSCREHSANAVECEDCGTRYEDWSGQWEAA
jgi:hypothetical protein